MRVEADPDACDVVLQRVARLRRKTHFEISIVLLQEVDQFGNGHGIPQCLGRAPRSTHTI
jgi:hypothetical protein